MIHVSLPILCLFMIGVPMPPEPAPRLMIVDATHLNLSWDPPFYLDLEKYPILYYEVQVTSTCCVEVFENRLMNGTYEIYSISATAETCHTLSFNVTATTAVGTSSPGEVKGGFPIREFLLTKTLCIQVYSHKTPFQQQCSIHTFSCIQSICITY